MHYAARPLSDTTSTPIQGRFVHGVSYAVYCACCMYNFTGPMESLDPRLPTEQPERRVPTAAAAATTPHHNYWYLP
jgi:hypothetical protein